MLAHADRHRDQPEPLRGKQHEDELGPVADQQREAIAAFEAERVQPGGEAFDLRVGLSIGPASAPADDGVMVAAGSGPSARKAHAC